MSEDEPAKKRLPGSVRTVFLFLLLVAAVAGAARYFLGQKEGNGQVYENIAVLNARLDNLEKSVLRHEERLSGVEGNVQKLASAAPTPSTPAPSPPPDTAASPAFYSGPAEERIAALEKQLAALKTVPAAGIAHPQRDMSEAIRLLSSFHHLSDKVLGGKPFAAELSSFEDMARADDALSTPLSQLAPYAESGIPTFATLLATFDQSMENLNSALGVPPAEAGFWERLKYNLMHLVSIRRVDEAQTGNSPQAVTGRAQAHLEREEYEAAAAEIRSLSENYRGNFSAWLDDVQMASDAPSLVEQLEEQVMQKAFRVETPPSPEAPPPAPAVSPAPAHEPEPPAPQQP